MDVYFVVPYPLSQQGINGIFIREVGGAHV
jgi:hypothetical protein